LNGTEERVKKKWFTGEKYSCQVAENERRWEKQRTGKMKWRESWDFERVDTGLYG